jgi:RNA polymerase sigma factor (sigma-70 family)
MARPVRVSHLSPARSEHHLVADVRRGDDSAFEELFSRYRARVGAYVRGMVRDHGRAEDLVQEVFLSALRRLRETDRPVAFQPWIYEIARNACIDEFRRTRRVYEVPLETDERSPRDDCNMTSHDPTPDAAVESKQRLEDLRRALDGLSESHHRILLLREFEGLSYREIGERMGMSRQVVESTLFRARRRLSEEFDELVSGRRCEQIRTLIDGHGARSVATLGARQRRLLARHLGQCPACRREAWIAGLDRALPAAKAAGKPATLTSLRVPPHRASTRQDQVIAKAGSAA